MTSVSELQFSNRWGETLAATLHLPKAPSPKGVVCGHCFTCSRHTTILRRVGDALAQNGFSVLRFDFSGNGQSEGEFPDSTLSKQTAELEDGVAFLQRRGISWIGLLGHSMGATAALLAAGRMTDVRAVATLATRCRTFAPADFLTAEGEAELAATGRTRFKSRGRSLVFTRSFFEDASRHDLAAVLASLAIPLLIVHGDRDGLIPAAEATCLRRLKAGPANLAVIKGADHMFRQDHHGRQVAGLVAGWFGGLAAA